MKIVDYGASNFFWDLTMNSKSAKLATLACLQIAVTYSSCAFAQESQAGLLNAPVSISSTSGCFAVSVNENIPSIRDLTTGSEIHRLSGHTTAITSIRFSPDGTLLATGDQSGNIVVHSVQGGDAIWSCADFKHPVANMAFSKTGRNLAASNSEMAKVWEISTNRLLGSLELPSADQSNPFHEGNYLRAISFGDAEKLHAVTNGHSLVIWNIVNETHCIRQMSPTGFVRACEFFETESGSHRALVAIDDRPMSKALLRVLELDGTEITSTLSRTGKSVKTLAKADTVDIGAVGFGNKVQLFNLTTGLQHAEVIELDSEVLAVALNPDGKYLVTTSATGNVSVWDVESSDRLHSFQK